MSRGFTFAACVLTSALATLLPGAGRAQDAVLPESCRVMDASAVIRVVVCTDPLDQADLALAGRAACGAVLPCGAWIWPDAALAPAAAPANHDGLTPEQITSSRGVWVAEDEMFIAIDAVAN